jgi:hypothetical protein
VVMSNAEVQQVGRAGRRVRPDDPRGAVAHRGGPRCRRHHLQGDREGRLPHRRARGARRPGARGRPRRA